MDKKFYTVNNIPLLYRPVYLFLSWLLGLSVYSFFVLFHLLCRIKYKGKEHLIPSQNYIYCMWHHNLLPYFMVYTKYKAPYVWLNHPAWFMKPIHILLKLIGTQEIAMGSSGHSGKAGLEEVIGYLKRGYNTVITPDGPSGPVKELKKGVLDMSLASGIPVVPLKIQTPERFILKATWDNKRIPIPFSAIIVEFGKPVIVNEENYEIARREIIEQM